MGDYVHVAYFNVMNKGIIATGNTGVCGQVQALSLYKAIIGWEGPGFTCG